LGVKEVKKLSMEGFRNDKLLPFEDQAPGRRIWTAADFFWVPPGEWQEYTEPTPALIERGAEFLQENSPGFTYHGFVHASRPWASKDATYNRKGFACNAFLS
jgi:hypothetical protein